MRLIPTGMGPIFGLLTLMTQIGPKDATGALQGWLREAGIHPIADYLGSPPVDYAIRHYAVWVLLFCTIGCFVPLIHTGATKLFIRRDIGNVLPDMKIRDAIDYIVNDSRSKFDEPYRPEAPNNFPPDVHMLVVNGLTAQAQRKLHDKINTGEVRAWGRRQIDTIGKDKFESSLREIPLVYWNDMRLDFQSARYYKGAYSQTMPIQGKKATYNWADINVSQAQIGTYWPKKSIAVSIYSQIHKMIC
jgi:hypothetical protein